MTIDHLPAAPLPSPKRQRSQRKPTKRVITRQARNMMEGLDFAKEIGTPLNAHLTIHWGGTGVQDDPDGARFAHFRSLLDKRLKRQNIKGGLTAIWVRERCRNKCTRQLSEVVHSHILLHLPSHFERNPYRKAFLKAVDELIELIAGGNLDDRTIKLTFPKIPDGKYFLKGATRAVWETYNVPDRAGCRWRNKRGEGIIQGKRCGTTQNIGPTARNERLSDRQHQVIMATA